MQPLAGFHSQDSDGPGAVHLSAASSLFKITSRKERKKLVGFRDRAGTDGLLNLEVAGHLAKIPWDPSQTITSRWDGSPS